MARDGVIGAIHPHRLREFVDGVPEPVLKRAERATLAAFSLMVSHYDLKEKAQFYAGERRQRTRSCSSSWRATAWRTCWRTSTACAAAASPSACSAPAATKASATRAACRRARACSTASPSRPTIWPTAARRRWDEIREQMGDRSLAHYRKFVKNLTDDNIIKRTVVTPLDHQRNLPNSMVRGDVHGVAPYFYQSASHRPTPDLGQFTVPGVERLYLVGPFHASGRRRHRRRPRHRDEDVRGPRHGLRQGRAEEGAERT